MTKFIYMTIIVPATVIIPLVAAWSNRRWLRGPDQIIVLFLLVMGIVNGVACWKAWHKQNNLFLVHIYTCLEFLIICLFFHTILERKRIKKLIPFLALLYIIAAVLNSLLLQDIRSFNTYALSVSAIITIAFCLYYYASGLAAREPYLWRRDPVFWFVTGFITYFSSALFLFILSNFTLVMRKPLALTLWNIHATMVLIMYLLFTAGFSYAKRER